MAHADPEPVRRSASRECRLGWRRWTTFHFVTQGFPAALERARAAAGTIDVAIAGGASTVRQALATGALDEIVLDVIPILLGEGERPFDVLRDIELEPREVGHSPNATHIRYERR